MPSVLFVYGRLTKQGEVSILVLTDDITEGGCGMKRKLICLLLGAAMLFALTVTASAASAEAALAADALHELGLFNGTGTDANGKPIYDLNRAPTRHEAVTMLVRLLGKGEEAVSGTWETPFTDVADWAKPYVGYAYAHGLTSGTGATTFGGNSPITASQYITFVLRALGYESGTDFQWDKAWELSDRIGLTDGRYNASKEFLRGDVTIVSRSAMDVQQKDSDSTLADKLIAENIFSAEDYQKATETPDIVKEEPFPDVPVTFSICGKKIDLTFRTGAGTYTVTPYLNGIPFSDYEIEVTMGNAAVTKNSDGTFDVDFAAENRVHLALWYDIHEVVETDEEGKKSSYISKTKRSLAFEIPISADSGLVLDHNGDNMLPGTTFGDNYRNRFVMDVYYHGVRVTDYAAEASSGAPFTVSKQADGSLLVQKTGNGRGEIIVAYQGERAVFGLFIS